MHTRKTSKVKTPASKMRGSGKTAPRRLERGFLPTSDAKRVKVREGRERMGREKRLEGKEM